MDWQMVFITPTCIALFLRPFVTLGEWGDRTAAKHPENEGATFKTVLT